ncbi:translation initiation factor eIF-2B [bacterium]|nr:translation initiation factor eIF-2B [bacterium]
MSEGIERKLEAIFRDRTHGAAFLAKQSLRAMKLSAVEGEAGEADSFLREMARLGTRIVRLRPSMSAPICNGIVRMFDAISQEARSVRDVRELKEFARRAVDRLLVVSEENVRKTAMHVCRAIPEGATVLTHSYSETCLRALLACEEKGVRVFATESRPLFEGRAMAESLRKGRVQVTLLTDAEAGHFMGDVQVVLVGADTVLMDGSLINKIGTYLLALAARDKDVPFRVACDSWKFRIEGGVPDLEEKSPDEVVDSASGMAARNVYFDLTPPRLITSLVTEVGDMKPEEVGLRSERWKEVLRGMFEMARS